MKSKKTETKKLKKDLLVEDEHEEKISIPEGDEPVEESPDAIVGTLPEDVDDHITPDAIVADETAESPDEVGFDDLTDDEREMLGLEAKPKVAVDEDSEEAGTSWQEFGYDEEEL